MNTPAFAYEIVFGHRRHCACMELGLPVLALVENLTEQEWFEHARKRSLRNPEILGHLSKFRSALSTYVGHNYRTLLANKQNFRLCATLPTQVNS